MTDDQGVRRPLAQPRGRHRRAGEAQAAAIQRLAHRAPHEAALAAHVPSGPTVRELEQRIRAWQARHWGRPTDASPPTG